MLTADQEKYILDHAYIPEHTVGLMISLSGGEGFLVDDFFLCRRDDWVIVVGYPLKAEFAPVQLDAVLEKIRKDFKPARISLIAPHAVGSVIGFGLRSYALALQSFRKISGDRGQ